MQAILIFLLQATTALDGSIRGLQDESREAREHAVSALVACDPGAVRALLDHADGRVREGACEALVRMNDPTSIPALLLCADDAAADAIVRLARLHLLDIPSIALLADKATKVRLRAANAAFVHAHFARTNGSARFSSPRFHRPILSGGAWSAEVVRALVQDVSALEDQRSQATLALLLLEGHGATDLLISLLTDSRRTVQVTAASALSSLASRKGLAALASLLDAETQPHRALIPYALRGVGGTHGVSDRAKKRLVVILRDNSAWYAAAGTQALARIDEDLRNKELLRRIQQLRSQDRELETGLFLLRVDAATLTDQMPEIARFAAESKLSLIRATTAPRIQSLALIRPHLKPIPGPKERLRAYLVGALLTRHKAPAADRLAYAEPLLATDSAYWHASALAHLGFVPTALRNHLDLRIHVALNGPYVATRVRAASLLLPDPKARHVLWLALYDGSPSAAIWSGSALGVDGRAPISERRRWAREAIAELAEKK